MDNIEIFKTIPLFQDLSPQELTKVGGICQKVSFRKGDRIFEYGDKGDALYIIRSGGVEVILPCGKAGEQEIVAKLGPGDIVGEMALFEKAPRSASIEAVEDSRMFRIKREYFDKLIEENHEISLKLYKRLTVLLCSRLRDTTERLAIANSIIRASS